MTALQNRFEQNLGWAILLLLFTGCLLVLWPFATALLWAAVLAFSTWPLYRRVLKLLRGKRNTAALVVCVGMVVAVVLPLGISALALQDNVKEFKASARRWVENGAPRPPAWLAKVPWVGQTAAANWESLAADKEKLAQKARSLIEPVGTWLLKVGLKLGVGLAEMVLSILLSYFLLRNGEALAERLKSGMGRIAGERGAFLLGVAGNTVRGVVNGMLGTALVQALLAGIGLVIAGVPGAGLLALLTFVLAIFPLGTSITLVPAALWLFYQGSTSWGIFMLIWAIGVGTVDNFVKPWLISQGSQMPFPLILLGVLGGALAFGFIGVFIGPTLLAVAYRVVREWSSGSGTSKEAPEGGAISRALGHSESVFKA